MKANQSWITIDLMPLLFLYAFAAACAAIGFGFSLVKIRGSNRSELVAALRKMQAGIENDRRILRRFEIRPSKLKASRARTESDLEWLETTLTATQKQMDKTTLARSEAYDDVIAIRRDLEIAENDVLTLARAVMEAKYQHFEAQAGTPQASQFSTILEQRQRQVADGKIRVQHLHEAYVEAQFRLRALDHQVEAIRKDLNRLRNRRAELRKRLEKIDCGLGLLSEAIPDLRNSLRASESTFALKIHSLPADVLAGVLPESAAGTWYSPLRRLHGWIVILFFILLATVTALATCVIPKWAWPSMIPVSPVAVLLFIIVAGLMSFNGAPSASAFYYALAILVLAYGPTVLESVIGTSVVTFLFQLLIIHAAAIWYATPRLRQPLFDSIIDAAYVFWIVYGVCILVIQMGILASPDIDHELSRIFPPDALSAVRASVGFRYFATVVLALLLFVKATVAAFSTPHVQINHVRSPPRLQPPSNAVSLFWSVAIPFLVLLNILAGLLYFILDVLWVAVATLVGYLSRIGRNLGTMLHDLTTRKGIWGRVARVIGCYSIVYTICMIAKRLSVLLESYLISDIPVVAVISADRRVLGEALALVFALLLLVMAHSWLFWRDRAVGIQINRAGFGGTVVVLSCLISGFALHVMSALKVLTLKGFGTVGPFSLAVACILAIAAFAAWVVRSKPV